MNGEETAGSTHPGVSKAEWFGATSWINVTAARDGNAAASRQALEQLCATYWYPIYCYVRRSGFNAQDAEDVTQGFFFQLLEKNFLATVDQKKGKFRSFLLAAVNHFISNHRDYVNAAKRGGGKTIVSLDEQDAEERYLLEPTADHPPERIFEAGWATTVMARANQALSREYAAAGKSATYEGLKVYLREDPSAGEYLDVARRLDMTSGAVAVAVHRLRQRYGEIIRAEIAHTVDSPGDIESELRHLCSVLGEAGWR